MCLLHLAWHDYYTPSLSLLQTPFDASTQVSHLIHWHSSVAHCLLVIACTTHHSIRIAVLAVLPLLL